MSSACIDANSFQAAHRRSSFSQNYSHTIVNSQKRLDFFARFRIESDNDCISSSDVHTAKTTVKKISTPSVVRIDSVELDKNLLIQTASVRFIVQLL